MIAGKLIKNVLQEGTKFAWHIFPAAIILLVPRSDSFADFFIALYCCFHVYFLREIIEEGADGYGVKFRDKIRTAMKFWVFFTVIAGPPIVLRLFWDNYLAFGIYFGVNLHFLLKITEPLQKKYRAFR